MFKSSDTEDPDKETDLPETEDDGKQEMDMSWFYSGGMCMENTNRKDRYCCGNYWFYRIMCINHRTYNPVGTYVQKKIMAIKKQPLILWPSMVAFLRNL